MLAKLIAPAVVFGVLLAGAEKGPPENRASNNAVEIAAKLYNGRDAVRQAVGSDLDGVIVVVEVSIAPKTAEPLAVRLDDFLLRSDKDGQRSAPFTPSQIAGKGTLMITEGGGGRAVMGDNRGPVWGGYPGSRPGRLGGDGGAIGNTANTTAQSSAHSGSKDAEDPLLATLKAKVLPETSASKPVSGLLYFLMEGKHKTKQLEVLYRGPAGRLSLRFKD